MFPGISNPPTLSKVVSATYDLSTASGNQDITGFGFNPTSVHIAFGKHAGIGHGVGFASASGPSQGSSSLDTAGGSICFVNTTNAVVLFHSDGTTGKLGAVSFIADGIRIAWTKFGSPTGTLTMVIFGRN
jgi:hypothetical protein